LVVVVSAVYFGMLLTSQTLLPREFNVPLYLLVVPLLMVVLVLVRELSGSATVPAETMERGSKRKRLGWKVQQLTRQIEVGGRASGEYYDTVLLARLREILVEKVSLETGMEMARVKETLRNKVLGPSMLRERELYTILYSPAAGPGPERVRDLARAVGLIEAWKA